MIMIPQITYMKVVAAVLVSGVHMRRSRAIPSKALPYWSMI